MLDHPFNTGALRKEFKYNRVHNWLKKKYKIQHEYKQHRKSQAYNM